MEIAADPKMPTYSGGLGVLAGDFLQSCADLHLPIIAVSLIHAKGYFEQTLDEWGYQHEQFVSWEFSRFVKPLPITVQVSIAGRPVTVRAWEYTMKGLGGHMVPVILLDTNVPEECASRSGTHDVSVRR